jgi:PST family polysaccharide transporter
VPTTARTVARASTWAALGVAASKGLSLATTLILARVLLPADFGAVALAAVLTDLLLLLQDAGLSPALVQHRGDPRAAAATVLRLHLRIALALVATVVVLAGPAARLLGDAAIAPLVRALGLGILLRGVTLAPRAVLQRTLAFRALAIAEIGGRAARAAVAILLAWRGAGAWSLVAGSVAALGCESALVWLACGPLPLRAAASPDVRAALLRFGRPMTLASVVVWARDGVTRVLVGRLLGETELGYFHLAARIAAAPVTGITHVTNRVALPVYAAESDRAALRRTYRTTLRIVSLLALPACAALVATAPLAVAVAFGPAWAPIVAPMRILLVASMASALAATTGELFKAIGRPTDLLRTAVPHLCLLLVAVPLGAAWGLPGIACAIAVVRVTMALVALALAARHVRLRARELAESLAPAVAGIAVMLIALGAARALGPDPSPPTTSAFVAYGVVAALAYALSLLAWRGAAGRRAFSS